MRIHGCMIFLAHLAEPIRQQAVERHGNEDAGHADVAVADDLETIQQVSDADNQNHDRAGCQSHCQDRWPQVETIDIGCGYSRPVARAGNIQEF